MVAGGAEVFCDARDVVAAGDEMYVFGPGGLKAQADVNVVGLIVSLNREEQGKTGEGTALDEISRTYGFPTAAIVSMSEVTEALYNREVCGRIVIDDDIKSRIDDYYAQYGA